MQIGSIIIEGKFAYDSFIEHSKTWKTILGGRLMDAYKERLDYLVEFIKDQELVLALPINDLDDVQRAMNCLDKIRENSIE